MLFTSYEKLLILRFLYSKKSDGFISIFSWFSIIGITIGVGAIIIVMSVMNGFREEITSRLLGINGHLNIYSDKNEILKDELDYFLKLNNNILLTPLTQTQALLISKNSSKGVFLRGYDLNFLSESHFIYSKIKHGKLFSNKNEIIIGYALAKNLGLKIGDKVKIAIPKTDKTIFGNIPRFKTLNIVGIFNLGMYEYDSNFVFTNSEIANKLILINKESFNKIEVFIDDPNLIEKDQKIINKIINDNNLNFYTENWKQNNSALINALNIEKNVMFLILSLIIIVASMNIISGLIIFVKEKNKDIGILKTIGLSNYSLIKIFISIGFIIGLTGTFFGGLLGILFSINITSIQNFIEKLFNTTLFSREIYYLSNLPSKLIFIEVFVVLLISVIICLIATTFPAIRSIKIDPIKSLKND
ncbi:lipoprotein-releasing ABC transporter permease subunit [Alphaproteobacteria bacterium]|nr:lipoprotein-releasing ABC transporter permease subunit [Alphaproteobacteria bacterium]